MNEGQTGIKMNAVEPDLGKFHVILFKTLYGWTKIIQIALIIIKIVVLAIHKDPDILLPLGVKGKDYFWAFNYFFLATTLLYLLVRTFYAFSSILMKEIELNIAISSFAFIIAAYMDILRGQVEFKIISLLFLPLHVYLLQVLSFFLLDNLIIKKAPIVKGTLFPYPTGRLLPNLVRSIISDENYAYEVRANDETRIIVSRNIIYKKPSFIIVNTVIKFIYANGVIVISDRTTRITFLK